VPVPQPLSLSEKSSSNKVRTGTGASPDTPGMDGTPDSALQAIPAVASASMNQTMLEGNLRRIFSPPIDFPGIPSGAAA